MRTRVTCRTSEERSGECTMPLQIMSLTEAVRTPWENGRVTARWTDSCSEKHCSRRPKHCWWHEMNPEALKQNIENQKSDEILQCIDKLCELTGTERFSDQLNQLSSALRESQEDLMKKTGMSREEVEK